MQHKEIHPNMYFALLKVCVWVCKNKESERKKEEVKRLRISLNYQCTFYLS